MTSRIINKDCLEGLKELQDESVDCCVTSPPYWGLRDYGIEGQLGLEKTPEEYIEKMVAIFSEVRRVIKKDGTLWLNIGDSYAGSGSPGGDFKNGKKGDVYLRPYNRKGEYLKPKDLCGIPWMLAFALRKEGWYLRQDIIWHKPNPMPESVTDRCTKAHEYIFLLSKNLKYYFDNNAIREPVSVISLKRSEYKYNCDRPSTKNNAMGDNNGIHVKKMGTRFVNPNGRNKRSVWTVPTKPYKGAHFATFPQELIIPCILAGCREGGTVLDPFFGAGTVGVVCRLLHRNYIGIELNPEYISLAEKRIANTYPTLFPSAN